MKIRTDHARHRASRRGFARRPGFTVRFRQGFSLALAFLFALLPVTPVFAATPAGRTKRS